MTGLRIVAGLTCLAIGWIGWYIANSYGLSNLQLTFVALGGTAVLGALFANAAY